MSNLKFLDEKGVQHLWNQLSLEDYPNNEVLMAVLNAIDETKADKSELNDYLTKEDYIAGESGGSIDLSNLLTKTEAQTLYAPKNILETVYPIGAIYLSTNNVNPNTLFGFGSWEQIKDTFLLAAGDIYAADSTGGEAEHILTTEEMPAHTHNIELFASDSGSTQYFYTMSGGISNKTSSTLNTGGSQPHNNMPPYLSVYVWKRIS